MAAKKKASKKAAKKKTAKAPAKKKAAKAASSKTAASKKAAKKAPAKKKVAAKKKAAAKAPAKPALKKRAAAKKAPAKRAKSAATKKAATKSAARKKVTAPTEGDVTAEGVAEEGVAEEGVAQAAPKTEPAEVASVGLTRGRRRAGAPRRATVPAAPRAEIPPLPDEDEDFVPFEPEPEPPRRRRPRRKRGPGVDRALVQRLGKVRAGDAHISELDTLTADEIEALARHAGLRPRAGETPSETIFRLVNEGADDPSSKARAGGRGGRDTSGRDVPGRDVPGRDVPSRDRRGRSKAAVPVEELVHVEGLLELHPDGYGFLRQPGRSYTQHPEDVYVAVGLVRRLGLRAGHWLSGKANRRRPNQPQLALHSIDEVNHEDPEKVRDLVEFDKLTVVYPDQRLPLETTPEDLEMRIMDLFCPLGRGQRGLIVAPPRTGKTIMLTKLADAIAANSPDVDIVVLLVDERPEEVTNMSRSVRGEVVASTFDKPASNHIRVAELVMEKVKRMVEFGRHVVLLLDSITRMGRAYNNATGGSGRILTGGLDAKALTKPKRFFGSARNVEGGGSLTIVATALIDTGSRMDQVIFEEFKGTGNMELVLNRDMANARVWPAIDVPASATRNEDLLMHPDELRRITMLRRAITGQDPQGVMLTLREQLKANATNAEFLMRLGN